MERETRPDGETSEAHSNRRRFLKGVGAATVGAVAVTGTASAQQYQFDGCRQVYSDTDADIAVVATGDGFECRSITEAVDAADVPWEWGGYRYEAEPGEVIVGAVEEDAWQGRHVFDRWTCELELNPSDCAGRFYESAYQVKTALNENEDCGACAGTIVRGNGDGVTTRPDDAEATAGNATQATDDDGTGDGDAAGGAGDGDDSETQADTGTDAETDEVDAATSIAGTVRAYVNAQFGL